MGYSNRQVVQTSVASKEINWIGNEIGICIGLGWKMCVCVFVHLWWTSSTSHINPTVSSRSQRRVIVRNLRLEYVCRF